MPAAAILDAPPADAPATLEIEPAPPETKETAAAPTTTWVLDTEPLPPALEPYRSLIKRAQAGTLPVAECVPEGSATGRTESLPPFLIGGRRVFDVNRYVRMNANDYCLTLRRGDAETGRECLERLAAAREWDEERKRKADAGDKD